MKKVIKIGVEARNGLAAGVDKLAAIVVPTLGPYGQNVYIDKGNAITNDGIKVAREVVLEDEVEQRGVTAAREAASKTNDIVGDATTTSILFIQAIYKVCSTLLGKANVIGAKKPSEIISQIEAERKEITDKLIAMATPITTVEQLIASARVSTESEELGTLIGQAQWDIGKDGYLLVEETNERTSSIEKVKGIRIDNGAGTAQVFNNLEKQSMEVEDVGIILTSYTIKDGTQWNALAKQIFEPAHTAGFKEIVVVARAWTDETINLCLQNIKQGSLKIYPVSAPYINMTERMKDLSAVTGATFYDSENSSFDDMYVSGIGNAKKVVAKRMEAVITGVDNDQTNGRVAKRVEELQKELDGEESEFAKKQLQERIAQLSNGFAIVKVGSPSDLERKRLFDKCEDAVNAVRAAWQEGVVPGAGLAFKQIAETLPDTYLLKRPIMSLNEQLMSSAPSDFVIESWVQDPVKVLRVALEQACVAASALATAGGVITQKNPDDLSALLRPQNTNE